MELHLQLPQGGVGTAFPDEGTCHGRLIAVRWPEGPECPRCSSRDAGHLEARKIYHCRACLKQFTSTSSTIFHRARTGLQSWFRAGELIILKRIYPGYMEKLTAHSFSEHLGISHEAADRMMQIMHRDLSNSAESLLLKCICTREGPSRPRGIEHGGREHYDWLSDLSLKKLRREH
ncbi:transposase [Limimaricola cinnabarinus]|uniref:transposase n=1 Tax=Limimaricola cinnabarinus TaxID=1125964 RepID=UPI003D7F0C17